jgi:polar amino acid transport system substrate-binding protein
MRPLGALLIVLMLASAARADQPEALVIATDGYRPVAWLENGHPIGAMCEVLTEAARRAGIPLEFRFLPWARAMQEARAGRIDAIYPVFRTPERDSYLAFPEEVLMDERMAWFVRADAPVPFDGDLKALAGRRIGIINQSSYGPRLDAALHDQTLPDPQNVGDTTGAVRILVAGRVDLIPGFDQGIWAEARGLGLEARIHELAPPVEDVPAYLAFSRARNMSAESRAIDTALRAMKEDGTYQKILARYFMIKE